MGTEWSHRESSQKKGDAGGIGFCRQGSVTSCHYAPSRPKVLHVKISKLHVQLNRLYILSTRVSACSCIQVHVSVWVYICVCVWGGGLKINLKHQESSCLSFEAGLLLGTWGSSVRQARLANEPQGCTCLGIPASLLWDCTHVPSCLTLNAGSGS